jgi:hypothetical protein
LAKPRFPRGHFSNVTDFPRVSNRAPKRTTDAVGAIVGLITRHALADANDDQVRAPDWSLHRGG